ncbi:unnamed protein product [Spirodela intermedia]|uniref:Uncharacterized protein n=1 Tax=Spirodela intermedia TaxID=51605 RepID=A0A7I8KMN1_SPIIN|nr:unnamed protein product [Spirodela intermedia]
MAHVSDIKLIRTDTTLDLSQKAEKEFQKCFERELCGSILDFRIDGLIDEKNQIASQIKMRGYT